MDADGGNSPERPNPAFPSPIHPTVYTYAKRASLLTRRGFRIERGTRRDDGPSATPWPAALEAHETYATELGR